MTGSIISNTVTHSVTLGSGGYYSPLTITSTGAIVPEQGGANALIVPKGLKDATVMNQGVLSGSLGVYAATGSIGGAGIDAASHVNITSSGRISGGYGGLSNNGVGYSGGNGVNLRGGGTLSNTGLIEGGYGNTVAASGTVAGGIGVDVTQRANILNGGDIYGGNGGRINYVDGYGGGNGGIGIILGQGGELTNNGVIGGGTGGYAYYFRTGSGGDGVFANGRVHIANTRLIEGGGNGGVGVYLGAGGVLTNSGDIVGGFSFAGGSGSVAVKLAGDSSVINSGTIRGSGGGSSYYPGGNGGAGLTTSGRATITNTGVIAGGDGGYGRNDGGGIGGVGVDLATGGTLVNDGGTIAGGGGGSCYYTMGTYGASGVVLGKASVFSNSGTVIGGSGGDGGGYGGYAGGSGGTAVILSNGGTVTNSGDIEGGKGGSGSGRDDNGSGGAGVYLNGGTLINSGTISGGNGGKYGDAVQFGSRAGTLVVDPGAVFVNDVKADGKVDDVLQLAGSTPGTLRALGTHFIGFTTLTEDSGATWTLSLPSSLGAGSSLIDAGIMAIQHGLTDAGSGTITGQGVLETTQNAEIQINALTLSGGTLMCSATGTIMIGATGAGGSAGIVSLESGATVAGAGVIESASSVIDDGTLVANGGTLTVQGSLGGTGSLQIDGGATLIEDGTLSVSKVAFESGGNAHLVVSAAIPTNPPLPLFSGFGSGDVIDLQSVKANALAFSNGTLTLENGNKVVDTLLFAGDYSSANFTLSADNKGGTDINYVATGGRGSAALPDFATLLGTSSEPHGIVNDYWASFRPDNPIGADETQVWWHHLAP